ncbi:MAG: dihydrofolate reductase [Rhodobiaceae bacterium]|nr:dihydrofolate reductase [Rhodobiaceae bacterium]MCC0055702.1 dihydrofolate reductase [Rhodobiaceae bacterium]
MSQAPRPRNPVARALAGKRGGAFSEKPRDDGARGDGVSLIIVVAAGSNGVIGVDGGLPWHISSDLKRFKALTMGKPIVMGRRTWDSIGRPLPGRDNIVVTRDVAFAFEGVHAASSLDEALALGARLAAARGVDEIAVIGGAEIYAQTLPEADTVYLTEVDAAPDGDAFFPALDPALWEVSSREQGERGPRDDHDFSYVTYRRRI